MKKILFKTGAILLLLGALHSCSKDDVVDNSSKNTQGESNSNPTTISKDYARLEFPKIKNTANNKVLIYKTTNGEVNYCVEWDTNKKSQRWSCYQMYRSNLTKNTNRYYTSDYRYQYPYDPSLPSQFTITPDPYRGSGYNHGHICPSADRLNNKEAQYQTFYMTNMQPQKHDFNAGVWLEMENKVRNWATKNNYNFADTLYVCKGGTIDNSAQYTTTGKGMVVPSHFFMAILRVKNGVYNAVGFWVKHENNKDNKLAKYAVSIKELEEKTGIDFFCNLPDNIERTVEAVPVNNNLWDLK